MENIDAHKGATWTEGAVEELLEEAKVVGGEEKQEEAVTKVLPVVVTRTPYFVLRVLDTRYLLRLRNRQQNTHTHTHTPSVCERDTRRLLKTRRRIEFINWQQMFFQCLGGCCCCCCCLIAFFLLLLHFFHIQLSVVLLLFIVVVIVVVVVCFSFFFCFMNHNVFCSWLLWRVLLRARLTVVIVFSPQAI